MKFTIYSAFQFSFLSDVKKNICIYIHILHGMYVYTYATRFFSVGDRQ